MLRKTLASLTILLTISSFSFAFAQKPNMPAEDWDIQDENPEDNALAPIITDESEVLLTYKLGTSKHNVISIPSWKNDIMDKIGLSDDDKIFYHAINTIECSREDGFCKGADVGPFQINQIHRADWNKSYKFIKNKDKEGLYEFQLRWTIERMSRSKCLKTTKEGTDARASCLFKYHNGNNAIQNGVRVKDFYAKKGLKVMSFLEDIINQPQDIGG